MKEAIEKGPGKQLLIDSLNLYNRPQGQRLVFYTHSDKKIIGHLCSFTYASQDDCELLLTLRTKGSKFINLEYNYSTRKGWVELDD